MGVSKNSTVAFYGKGGAGKSFLTSMVAKTLTDRDKRVLQMGCDPKHDSVVTHFGGAFIPTVLGTWAQFQKDGKDDDLAPEHIIFKGDGVYCIELGGPESARGCGGRGITFGFQLLEKWGLSEWNFNYMLLDFLGDVVCGGFGTPIARSMADKLVIVCSNEGQSMYAANNIASAVRYFAEQGGKTRLLGLFVNKDDGSGKAARLAEFLGVPVLATLPVIPQAELAHDGSLHPLVAAAVEKVIDAIDNREAMFPNRVDFHEFMCVLSGNAATMEGTAVSSDELWSLPDLEPELKAIPNGGAFDHRYVESEDDADKLLVPTVVSAGGFAVPSADW
jgi:chlorophyllide reductase iron protein subunit X